MSSQTLTTRAIIQGVDNLSAPFAKIASGVQRFAMTSQKHLDAVKGSYAAFATKVNAVPIIGGGLAGAMGFAGIQKQLTDYDRKARQVQALNTMSAREWSAHQSRFNAITDEFGISPEKVLHAAETYQQLTGSMKDFDNIARVAGKTSRITGTEMAEQIKEVNALARAFGKVATNKHDIEEIERVYLVAAKGMMGGAHAFGSAMKAFAPVATTIGLDLSQASSLVQMLGGQFEGGEIGTALKTIGLRIAAPKDPALRVLAAQGISPLDYMDVDQSKLANGPEGLRKALAAGGFDVKGKDLSKLFNGIDVSSFEGKKEFEKRYLAAMSAEFGVKTKKGGTKFQGHDRGDLLEIERQFLASLGARINPEKFLAILSKYKDNPQIMGRLFGGEHVAKGRDLLAQADHYHERLDHIRKAAAGFRYLHEKGTGTIKRADAIDQRWSVVGAWNSPSFQYDRMMGNMQAFWQSMGARGINSTLAGAFKYGADFFRQLQYVDPKKVQMIAGGLMGLAALPVGVFALKSLGSALGAVGAVGMAPVRLMGALAAMPYAATAAGMTRLGAGTRMLGATMAGNALMGMGRFVGFLGSIARFTAMGAAIGGVWMLAENWDQVTAAFANFNKTDAAKGLSATLSTLWGTAKGLGSDLVNAADSLFKMLGWKSETDGDEAATALAKMAGWAMSLAGFLNDALTALRSLFNPDVKPPAWAQFALDYNKAENDRILARAAKDPLAVPTTFPADAIIGPARASTSNPAADWFWTKLGFDMRDPLAVPGDASWGSTPFSNARGFEHSSPMTPEDIGGAIGSAINLEPVTAAQIEAATTITGNADGNRQAIVGAIDRLGPIMSAALASAAAASNKGFGGPANASSPAGGNATGAKR